MAAGDKFNPLEWYITAGIQYKQYGYRERPLYDAIYKIRKRVQ